MSGIDIGIIVIYFVVIIGVGVFAAKRAKTSDDYLVAGRRLGFGFSFACLCAVLLGGASTIGTTKLGYLYGISGIWLVAMLGLGLIIIAAVLVRKIYGMNIVTVSQMLTNRFGSKAGVLTAVVSAVYTMMVCATQVIAMGTILRSFLGWDPALSMIVVGGIVVLYTILGGMWAITLTDLIQFGLIVFGILFVLVPCALSSVGGFTTLTETLPPSYFDLTTIGWSVILQYFFLYCLGAMVGQDIWQRFLTAKSIKVARRSGIAAGLFALVYAIGCVVVGMCAQVYMPGVVDAQTIFATFAEQILPTGLLGIVLAAVLAVLMSTASGTLLASSSLLANDVIMPLLKKENSEPAVAGKAEEHKADDQGETLPPVAEIDTTDKKTVFTSRVLTLIIGAVAIVAAVAVNDVIAALDVSYAILSGALFCPIILGVFWKRATSRSAIISIVCSTIVIFVAMAFYGITAVEPIIFGLVVSFVLMVGLTLFDTRGEKGSVEEA